MDAIIVVDEDQRIIMFNTDAEKMFVCRAQDVIQSSIYRLLPERYQDVYKAQMRLLSGRPLFAQEVSTLRALRGLRTTGEEFPTEIYVARAEMDSKQVLTVLVRDVTEPPKGGEALRRAEALSREQFLRLPVAVIVTRGPKRKNELVNLKFSELFGYTIEDVPDEAHWWALAFTDEVYRQAVRSEWQARVEKALSSRADVEPMEANVHCKDGSRKHIEFYFASVGDTSLVSFVDLTDRQRVEAALRESEERFRLVANAAPVMIWMSGPDKLRTYFNQPWLDFTGRSIDTEKGNGWMAGVHADDVKAFVDAYINAFEHRQSFEIEYRLRRHDGEYRWILDLGVPRFNRDGSIAGYIGSCLDVTERKRAQEVLSNVSSKLIEAHEEERTRIARELHDDVNQRIALLVAALERLQQDLPVSEKQTKQRIEEARAEISDLGSDIQALSHRLHSSKLEYLGLNVAASSFCRELSEQKGVEIAFHSEGVPKVLSQEIALCLFRVLQEALQNAVKHSGARQFEVQLGPLQNEICLTVHDAGSGFEVEEAVKGRGLGITSMRERLKLVGGRLSIDSSPKSGTTIQASVPFLATAKSARAAG